MHTVHRTPALALATTTPRDVDADLDDGRGDEHLDRIAGIGIGEPPHDLVLLLAGHAPVEHADADPGQLALLQSRGGGQNGRRRRHRGLVGGVPHVDLLPRRVLLAEPGNPLLPKPWAERYPPGSTFKTVTASIAVEQDASLTREYPYVRSIPLPQTDGQRLRNFDDELCGGTLEVSFIRSCNTTYGQVGFDLGNVWANAVFAAVPCLKSAFFSRKMPLLRSMSTTLYMPVPTGLPAL